MKTLKIRWQRMLLHGRTCPRCASTELEVDRAFHALKQSLSSLGIDVILEKNELDPEAFARDVLESNRIWIGGRALEDLLNARVGQSLCCGPCGETECRTLEVGEKSYETVTADLIVKAGLVAASEIITGEPDEPSGACCPNAEKRLGEM